MAQAKKIEAPKSLWDIFKIILKSIPRVLLWRIPLLLLLIPGIWLLHTFLLVYVNEGFSSNHIWILDQILALRGRTIASMVFWFVFATLVPAVLRGIWRTRNPITYFRQLKESLSKVLKSFKNVDNHHMPFFIGGIAGFCFLSYIWKNNYLSLMILFFLLRGIVDFSQKSFLYILGRCAQNDFNTFFETKYTRRPVAVKESFYIYSGIGVAILFTLIPKIGDWGLLVVIACAVLMFIHRDKYFMSRTSSLLFFIGINGVILFLITQNLYADDGGWRESGGSFDRWVKSDGAVIAAIRGIPPAISAATGLILGTAVDSGIQAITDSVAGNMPVDITDDINGDLSEAEDDSKWVYSDELGREIPTEGAIDDKGRIYTKVPWDESGYAFVDKDEAAQLSAMAAAGKVWTSSGFVSPSDIAQREADWNNWKQESPILKKLIESEKRVDVIKENIKKIDENIEDIGLMDIRRKLKYGDKLDKTDLELLKKASDRFKDSCIVKKDTVYGYKKNNFEKGLEAVVGKDLSQVIIDTTATGLRVTKFAADTSISVLGGATGPPGQLIAGGYAIMSNYFGGQSEAKANWAHNLNRRDYATLGDAESAAALDSSYNTATGVLGDQVLGRVFGEGGNMILKKIMKTRPKVVHNLMKKLIDKGMLKYCGGGVETLKGRFANYMVARNLMSGTFSEGVKNIYSITPLGAQSDKITGSLGKKAFDKIIEGVNTVADEVTK